jgi:signal transduction histidine kinase
VDHDFQSDLDAIAALDAVPTILEVVCRITGMGFAAVARVTQDRWIACAVRDEIAFGLKTGGELKVETTICHEIRQGGSAVAIDHVAESEIWRGHRTPAMYGFQSYISMPIFLRDGRFFGTLCAIDPRPAQLENPQTVGMFRLFAQLIASELDVGERLAKSETSLADERRSAELREQFIAILGHDLRNPLASIVGGTRMLLKEAQSERAREIGGMMQASVERMSSMIGNVTDFARARLGGGFVLETADVDLTPVLAQVAGELSAGFPGREIDMEIAIDAAVHSDPARIAQLFSNLLGNALAHGDQTQPVRVRAGLAGGVFALSVSNAGPEIAPQVRGRLFKPFARGAGRQGLGLGLYIAAEIARAHGGTLDVRSEPGETRFVFKMPVGG